MPKQKRRKKKITINDVKLGRTRIDGKEVLGWCDLHRFYVEIDPRQTSKGYLNTLIHELLHLMFPAASEREVIKSANVITREIWKRNYRKMIFD